MVVLQVLVLTFLNKRKEKARVALGKPAKVVDRSMDTAYVAGHVEIDPETGRHVETGADAFDDLTDFKSESNPPFEAEVDRGKGAGDADTSPPPPPSSRDPSWLVLTPSCSRLRVK